MPSPGSRHLLGCALTAVYEPHRNPLSLLAPGDEVRFVPGEGARLAEPEGRLAEMVQAARKIRQASR